MLAILVRISLKADPLVRLAKERFAAHGARYLILAKFLPGVNPLVSGVAGAFRTRPSQFFLYSTIGALAWAGAWITLGYLFAGVIEVILAAAAQAGPLLIIAIVGVLVLVVAVRYVRRFLFMRQLLRARIDVFELKQRLDRGENVVIVDLRTVLDIQASPLGIAGARWILPERLDGKHHPSRPACSWSSTARSPEKRPVRERRGLLSRHGYRNVRPLSGGLEAWRHAGFPVEPIRSDLGGT